MRTARRQLPAFTLLELVLVMLVITITLGIAAPNLRGFWAGARTKNAANQVSALTQWARSQAISQGRTYRLNIDPAGRNYSVTMQDQQQFIAAPSDLGDSFDMPDGSQITLVRDDGATGDHIDFFPDARTEPGTIHVLQGTQDIRIVCLSPTERFRVLSAAEALTK